MISDRVKISYRHILNCSQHVETIGAIIFERHWQRLFQYYNDEHKGHDMKMTEKGCYDKVFEFVKKELAKQVAHGCYYD